MVKKIKNSKKAGLSRAEIIRRMQGKGYKLEYIDVMMKKAEVGKKIIVFGVLFLIIGVLIGGYFFLFQKGEKLNLENPLNNLNVLFGERSDILKEINTSEKQEVHIEDVEITPDFFSYLLNELGGYNLRKHPLTGERPIIGFDIEGEEFYSIKKKSIESYKGGVEGEDLIIHSTKEVIVLSLLADEPVEVFKNSISEGETSMDVLASETKLFAKGYLDLYNSLK